MAERKDPPRTGRKPRYVDFVNDLGNVVYVQAEAVKAIQGAAETATSTLLLDGGHGLAVSMAADEVVAILEGVAAEEEEA